MATATISKYRDAGLLILRIGLGAMFIFHGAPKLMGGPALWEKIGMAMQVVGINFWPVVWGFLAALIECFGGILLMIGLFTAPACGLLTVVMAIATAMQLAKGDGLLAASHALELGMVFLSMTLIGPGKFSIDAKIQL